MATVLMSGREWDSGTGHILEIDNNDCNLPHIQQIGHFMIEISNNFSITKCRDVDVDNPGIRD